MTSSNENIFRVTGHFRGQFTSHRWALMFSLTRAWINGWVNNREAGDLRRQRAYYDATVTGYVLVSYLRQFEEELGLHTNSVGQAELNESCIVVRLTICKLGQHENLEGLSSWQFLTYKWTCLVPMDINHLFNNIFIFHFFIFFIFLYIMRRRFIQQFSMHNNLNVHKVWYIYVYIYISLW